MTAEWLSTGCDVEAAGADRRSSRSKSPDPHSAEYKSGLICARGVSGSMTSFRMSHEIVPVHPAGMSHHIVPVGTSAAGIAPETRKTMSRDIVPRLVPIGPEWQRKARR